MARGLAVAVVALLVAAVPAQAADKAATCATLPAVLGTVADGDVVTLNSSDGPGGLCNFAVTLPDFDTPGPAENYKIWTLQGRAGMNDGFDGTGVMGRVLTGNDVHRLLIQDLTFRDSSASAAGADGGAISITGEATLQVFSSEFYANTADDRGGAISFAPTFAPDAALNSISLLGNTFGSTTAAAEGNSAGTGGAVSIESASGGNMSLTSNVFGRNVADGNGGAVAYTAPSGGDNVSFNDNDFVANRAGGSGGGAHVVNAGSLRFGNDLYESNVVGPVTGVTDPAGDHFGGGVYVEDSGRLIQNDNVFRANAIEAFPNGQSYGGGGQAIFGGDLEAESSFDQFLGNTVAGQPDADFESEGGGLYVAGSGSSTFDGFLDVLAANSIGPFGVGGGVYVGAAGGETTLDLADSTVVANSAGGAFPGLAGDGPDELVLTNSIVYNAPVGADIGDFATADVQYTDACESPGTPFAGTGNICADPLLVNPAAGDIHQTKASPTIDKGNDELFFEQEESPDRDYEGDPRPTDGDGDGDTVDMGADETPAGFSTPPPPPPPPPPATPQCSDQVDNDGDGAIDLADPGCLPGPTDNNEGDETERDLVLCGQRTISLVRADVRGRRVVLSGIVAASVAGQRVRLSVRYLGGRGKAEQLGSVTPGADGRFQARVKRPPRRLFNFARYRARVASARSVELKLPQSLASSSLRQVAGGMLELRGQVDRALLGKRNAVVVRRILCGQYTTVGQAKPNRRGVYVVRFPAPASGGAALYRAESRVLARPGSKRYVRQFARALGITF